MHLTLFLEAPRIAGATCSRCFLAQRSLRSENGDKLDFDHLHIHHPELVHDLPTGAPRWSQKVTGYDFTILSGEITFENGKHTGVLPGKLVKNPRHLKERIARRMPLPDVPDEFKGYRKNMRIDENGSVNDMDTMLQASLNAESGISNASRIANALEEEQRSKL